MAAGYQSRRPYHWVVRWRIWHNPSVKVLFADLMGASNDAALDDRPGTFDCLSVDSANNVLLFSVVGDGVRVFLAKILVADPLIGAEQVQSDQSQPALSQEPDHQRLRTFQLMLARSLGTYFASLNHIISAR